MRNIASYTDKDLLQMLAQNDENAFAQLYERYWRSLYDYAYTILRLDDPAQDCVQEVFASLWERRCRSTIQSLEHYLKGAVRFQVLSAIRMQKVDRDFNKRLSLHLENIFLHDPLLLKEMEVFFRDIICMLPPDQQKIFSLSREQGLNYSQIAREMNISIKTVEKKISQSLRHIRLHSEGTIYAILAGFSCAVLSLTA